jgi:serine phosphatase RsbU (regulator of sigma subunit)
MPGGDRVEIKIRDTGIGIRETDIESIFDRFYQEDATATRRHEGSGLGLALVREYVELHNGTVRVWSRKGHGSEFVVELPVGSEGFQAVSVTAEADTDTAGAMGGHLGDLYTAGLLHATKVDAADSGDIGRTEREAILIVDDNRDMRDYMSEILKNRYRVFTAADGKEAFEKIREIGPALVISDVMMPEMDGIELLRALKSERETSGLPVILVTARSTEESKVVSLEIGADDYIAKPFNARELLARVANIMKIKSQEKDLLATYEKLNLAYTGIKNDLALARTIQEKLFPARIAPIRGMRFEIRYIPLIEVGGDIYDVCETGNGAVRVFLSDATGHGVSASLVTMLIKSEYDMIKHTSSGPADILQRLNSVFFSSYRSVVTFFTCIVVDIDASAGRITYSSAGHPGQFLLRAGAVVEMVATGRAIGVSERNNCHESQMQYQTGDRLFLFTDGLFEEVGCGNELFGEGRVADIIARNAACSVGEIVEALVSELRSFTGNRFRDDVTIIGIA